MRLVCVADTHLYHHDAYRVPEGDVLVHAGDMCQAGRRHTPTRHIVEAEKAARWIRSLPHRRKVVIAGNHDWAFQLRPEAARAELGDGVDYLRDSGVTIDGVRFWGSPWQPE